MCAAFWSQVGAGKIRLRRSDDRLLWHLRAQGEGWGYVTGRIVMQRQERSARARRLAAIRCQA